jgi:hypothetical protein
MSIHCITFGSYDYTKQVKRIKDEALYSVFLIQLQQLIRII